MSLNARFPVALVIGLALVLLFSGGDLAMSRETPETLPSKIQITGTDGKAVIVLYDNPVSRDFASLLPLSMSFRDYVGEEKIADLPRKLTTQTGLSGGEVKGDFAYYAPWGNLAVFYKGFGKGGGLYILGRIESGKGWLAGQHNDFTARIEVIEQSAQTQQQ